MSDEVLQLLQRTDALDSEVNALLTPEKAAALRYTDAMTKTVTVPDEVFAELKSHFNDREVVEVTSTAATYNCVSRFLVALNVGEMNKET